MKTYPLEPRVSPAIAVLLCFLFMASAIVAMAYMDHMGITAELVNGE